MARLPKREEFELALKHVRTWKAKISTKQKLHLYALFKQVEKGDCTAPEPPKTDVKERAKWKAWKKLEGTPVEECMDRYIELVSRIDPLFRSRALALQSEDTPEELKMLPLLAPPLDMNLIEKKDRRVSMISGINPFTGKTDDHERLKLYERIRKFYNKHDKSKLKTGIGDIVDWTLENGMEALNKNLEKRYKEDLDGFERQLAENEEKKKINTSQPEERKDTRPKDPETTELESKLFRFFEKYDPGRIGEGFQILLDYYKYRGLYALNTKLYEKYGANLEEFDDPPQHSQEQSEKFTVEHNMSKQSSEMSSKEEAVLRDVKIDDLLEYEIDEELMELLISYFAKYDPERLDNGNIELIYSWTQRNGFEALNERLKNQYNESLDEFADIAATLQDEVIGFYAKVDKQKLVSGVDHIINWGLKNGRAALNQKLRKKYGTDLDATTGNLQVAF